MSMRPTRRQVLKAGAAAGAGIAAGLSPAALIEALASGRTCGSLTDIKHVIFFIQENRSFDHYFGRYKGVRGFADRTAPGGVHAFSQTYAPQPKPTGYGDPLLPFHISTALGLPHQGQCTNDIEHQWAGEHDSWHKGANDNWMNSHLATDADARQAAIIMGYYEREDLPLYYQLADNFTICDNYFSSMLGGTDTNRLYSMTGTIDPDGWDGGCQFLSTKIGSIFNPGANLGTKGNWVPYPQLLQRAGITWKVYGTPDGQTGDNTLRYFPQFRPGGDPTLAANAFASNSFPADFAADCQFGRLPQVSWLLSGLADTEHAPAPLKWGEAITHSVLSALTTSGLWQNSVLFITYDENGGFFDHVPPPTPPAGTGGEFLNQAALTSACRAEATTVHGVDLSGDPIGLGFRVPMLVVSPFSRNNPTGPPLVCSEVFDHTSMLRFVETWTAAQGKPVPVPRRDPITRTPGLSDWRVATVGDLTGALNLAAKPDASVPSSLLANVPNRADPAVLDQCIVTGTIGTLSAATQPIVQDPSITSNKVPPRQEPAGGRVKRPSGLCDRPVSTPQAPMSAALVPAGALMVAAAWWARRRNAVAAEAGEPGD
jgi:phospholipase C